jgi:single-strand DNA-binding protein
VQGRLKSRSYETREGEKRTVFEIDVDEVGPSLRSATAKVTRASRSGGDSGYQSQAGGGAGGNDPWASSTAPSAGGGTPSADPWAAPAGGSTEDPPF